jgi:general stress protein 26
MTLTPHQQRIKKELAEAGMTTYGQFKMSSRHLPKVIDEDEHIKGVVYGHCGSGLAMLVATDRRVIYLERRPFFTSMDDISYDVVAGVKYVDAGIFPSVDLHTRMGDYSLTYVSQVAASRFEKYIESRIERQAGAAPSPVTAVTDTAPEFPVETKNVLNAEARDFLSQGEVCVLSTTDRTGGAQGTAIYYALGSDDKIYIITKGDTAKAHNMLANHQVALTVFDADAAKTVQIQGYAEIEADITTKQAIFKQLIRPRNYGGESRMPPIAELDAGGFISFRITPTNAKYTDYRQSSRIIASRPPV